MNLLRSILSLVALSPFSCATLVAEEELTPAPAIVATEYTLAIIKPNAVKANHIGEIIGRLEAGGLRVAAVKVVTLDQAQAEQFYAVHKNRAFFDTLVKFMTSGPIVPIALEGPNAVKRAREIMGETDPSKAGPTTIRADFGNSLTENAIHGSDSVENAQVEISFFFKPAELHERY